MKHVPVLLKEVIELLDPKEGEIIIDGTAGSGGHAGEILKKIGRSGKLLLIDWDKDNVRNLKKDFLKINVKIVSGNYADLPEIMKANNFLKADGLLLDLGFSSEQLGDQRLPAGRQGKGFSFSTAEPLIMTYSEETESLADFLKKASENELAEIIKKFGEERYYRQIAKAISEKRRIIKTTRDLAEIIKKAVPAGYERGRRHSGASRIHPATRTFQALRIYLNRELENLNKILWSLENILKNGGRIAIISFHSLEDRIVKNAFRELSKKGRLKILTKKPIRPGEEEVTKNPRARSAKLRAAIII